MNEQENIVSTSSQGQSADTARSRLRERPRRQSSRRLSALLLVVCGGLIILAGASVFIWQVIPHSTTPGADGSAPASKSAKQEHLPTGCTGARLPVDIIQQQTAQGLRLSVAQVQTRILAGKTVTQIAAEQHITQGQLHAIEIRTLHYANNRWLSMGCITQQAVQDNLRRDTGSPAYMDEEFTDWFKHP